MCIRDRRSYLRSMANGMCVDLWRRRNIEQAWLDTLAAQPEAVAPSAEHQAIVLEALREIDAMLRTLPPKVGRAFVMAVAGDVYKRQGCSRAVRSPADSRCRRRSR